MSKQIRQYIGIAAAILSYYIVHEGAHLIYALGIGSFRQIRFLGPGIQIDVYSDRMTDTQMGCFCLAGALATLIAGYALTALSKTICGLQSKLFRAILYYVTIVMLLLDPLYLSVLCGFFGGGDMNGISLLIPQICARILFGVLFFGNLILFCKVILPAYTRSFES